MNQNFTTRCGKEYEVNGRAERCVKDAGHRVGCPLTLWWSLKVPDLGMNIGTSVDGGEIVVRRVK